MRASSAASSKDGNAWPEGEAQWHCDAGEVGQDVGIWGNGFETSEKEGNVFDLTCLATLQSQNRINSQSQYSMRKERLWGTGFGTW